MAYETKNLIDNLRDARAFFLKHLDGISDEQSTWKPYEQCKSINETLDHLLWSDRTEVTLFASDGHPDYSNAPTGPPSETFGDLRSKLVQAHQELIDFLHRSYDDKPLDTQVNFYGTKMALGQALATLLGEEGYHTGQVSYIRQASDPSWDYYAAIY